MESPAIIRKRKVFYLCGFDPRSHRHYYQLFKQEAQNWQAITGKKLLISQRKKRNEYCVDWEIDNLTDDCHCDYSYLIWDDIVRANWLRNPMHIFRLSAKWYKTLLTSVDWASLSASEYSPVKLTFYPLVAFFLSLFFICLVLYLSLHTLPLWFSDGILLLSQVLLTVTIFSAYFYFFHIKIKNMWLLRLYLYHYSSFCKRPDELDARLDILAQEISKQIQHADYDEVLLISHSYGTTLSPILCGKLINYMGGTLPTNFSLISLGQLFPIVPCFKKPQYFLEDYIRFSQQSILWLDISSPADGTCFWQAKQPMLPWVNDMQLNLQIRSPRFHMLYSSKKYAKLKANQYQLHFLYLCTGEKNSRYNYYQLTLGNTSIDSAL